MDEKSLVERIADVVGWTNVQAENGGDWFSAYGPDGFYPLPDFNDSYAAVADAVLRRVAELEKSLGELWDKLVEYDMNTELEDAAQELGNALRNPGQPNGEWGEVRGIIEGVQVALRRERPS